MQPAWQLPLQAVGVEIKLAKGGRVRIRPVRTSDGDLLQDAYARMSERSRYQRFFSSRSNMSDRLVESLTNIDHTTHFAWLILDPDAPSGVGDEGDNDVADDDAGLVAGAARLILDDDATSAEAALALVDDYQGRGIGRFMIELLVATAADIETSVLRFEVLRQNGGMIRLVSGMGATNHSIPGDNSVVEFRLPVPEVNETLVPAGALYALLRRLAQRAAEEEAADKDEEFRTDRP